MSAIAKFWNRVARRYAAAQIRDVASYEHRMQMIEAELRPDMRVLDMASGSGMLAVRMAPKARQIDALDISPKMVEIARQRAADARVFNLRFTCAAIEDLTPPDFAYDAVLAMSVLHLLDDWRGAIAKAHALLRPGGVFISNTHCIEGERKRLKFFVKVGVPLGIMPNLQVFSRPDLLAAMRDAGFVVEREWQKDAGGAVMVVARKPG